MNNCHSAKELNHSETLHKEVNSKVIDHICKYSALGRLVHETELIHLIDEAIQALPEVNKEVEDLAAMLEMMIRDSEDIQILQGDADCYYYSDLYMTREFAQILFNKLKSPLQLIAETVRHHCRISQRPVPVELFEHYPFDLSPQQIGDCLTEMHSYNLYADIQRAETSVSSVYVYSSLYLEAGHAEMLAEWLEVGQLENP